MISTYTKDFSWKKKNGTNSPDFKKKERKRKEKSKSPDFNDKFQ
jgi:hypothetical protein